MLRSAAIGILTCYKYWFTELWKLMFTFSPMVTSWPLLFFLKEYLPLHFFANTIVEHYANLPLKFKKNICIVKKNVNSKFSPFYCLALLEYYKFTLVSLICKIWMKTNRWKMAKCTNKSGVKYEILQGQSIIYSL
jgi:hypothetical protein